jgi:hypothetical protein
MEQRYEKLLNLLERIPDYNISNTRSELEKIVAEYELIIEHLFYSHRLTIKKNLDQAKTAKTEWEKDRAFLNAAKSLRSDIKALLKLTKPEKVTF